MCGRPTVFVVLTLRQCIDEVRFLLILSQCDLACGVDVVYAWWSIVDFT